MTIARDPDGPNSSESSAGLLDKRAWDRSVRWLLISLTVVGCFYVFQRHQGLEQAPDETTAPAVALPSATEATVSGSSPPSDLHEGQTVAPAVTAAAPLTTTPVVEKPARGRAPRVPDVVRADFAKGAPWPVSVGSRDNRAVSWPLGLVDRSFVHGPPHGPGAASWLGRWLRSDVRALGVRVRFAAERSGSVAITAWRTSVLDARGTNSPRTGMRLEVRPGRWKLVVVDRRGTWTLGSGRYDQQGRVASFELVRRGQRLWVVDPARRITTVVDPRVASLAGPWASWELREKKAGMEPAALLAIWAG